jgi:hypothetical protein
MGDYNHMVASGTRFHMVWGDNRDTVGSRHDPNVYYAVAGTEDCYVRDNPADDGTVPSTPGQAWQSPDIIPAMNPSVFGTPNPVLVRAHNMGPRPATSVRVKFFWTDPATYIPVSAWRSDRITVETNPGIFTPTNEQMINSVPAGGFTETAKPFIWDPPPPAWATADRGHFCLLTQIESAGDPVTFAGGGWESIERDNNLAVRNVHVNDVGGNSPARIPFFIVGDLKERWLADLFFDPRPLPRGMALTVTLPAAIIKGAKLEYLKIVSERAREVTLAIEAGKVARIRGLQLAPKGRHLAELQIKPYKEAFKTATLTITQRVGGNVVGGLRYLLRPKNA